MSQRNEQPQQKEHGMFTLTLSTETIEATEDGVDACEGESSYETEDFECDDAVAAAEFIKDNLGHCELSSSFSCTQDITAHGWFSACDSETGMDGSATLLTVTLGNDVDDEDMRAICCELAKVKLLFGGEKLMGKLRLVG
jgi:hypothetical protein